MRRHGRRPRARTPRKAKGASPAGRRTEQAIHTDKVVQAFDSPLDEPVVNAVQQLAEGRGASMAQIALAWVLRNPLVSAPIVGATKPHHLPEAVDAFRLQLTDDEVEELEAPYHQSGPSWY